MENIFTRKDVRLYLVVLNAQDIGNVDPCILRTIRLGSESSLSLRCS